MFNLYKGNNANMGDKMDYSQRKMGNLGDLIRETLEMLELLGVTSQNFDLRGPQHTTGQVELLEPGDELGREDGLERSVVLHAGLRALLLAPSAAVFAALESVGQGDLAGGLAQAHEEFLVELGKRRR